MDNKKRIVWNKGKTPLGTCIKCGRTDKKMCSGGTKKPYCLDCRNEMERKSYNYEKDRIRHIKYWYKITKEDYDLMFEKQKGKCKICGNEMKRKNIDHDHKNGKVRALLCSRCNLSVGLIENEIWFNKARNYLKEFGINLK